MSREKVKQSRYRRDEGQASDVKCISAQANRSTQICEQQSRESEVERVSCVKERIR
jgi:hypothetical protein